MAVVLALVLLFPGCTAGGTQSPDAAGVSVIARFPHDGRAYTQGLLWHDGALYEGTGLLGESTLRRVDLTTGDVLKRVDLSDDRFGEGIAIVGDRLYQLTWNAGVAYVYALDTFAVVDSMQYEGEGWGLTYDGTHLILSDGTDRLRFIDPADFREVRSVQVTDNGAPLTSLNELEYIEGEVWANVYQSDYLVRIDPATGAVNSWVDLRNLLERSDRSGSVDVLNGIAWDPAGRRLFVTGKRWPWLFEVAMPGGADGG
jgi:glutamine cyclotransferase